MDMMNKKKTIMISLLILGGIILVLASAYAFYSFRAISNNGRLSSGGIKIEYVEGVEGINLTNALPMLDGEGIVSENSFSFEVNGFSNNKDTLVEYAISVVDGDVPNGYSEEDRVDDIAVKVYLEDSNHDQIYLGSPANGDIIYKSYIKGGTKNNLINNTYTLKMWISEGVLISDTNTLEDFPDYDILFTPSEFKTKFASVKINIDAYNINEANSPVLPDGMIPIKYNESIHEWVKADINNLNDDWYNYYDKKWANAVMVKETSTDNTSMSGLPSEYTELEYIESTGTQYIDTGVIPNNNTDVELTFKTSLGARPNESVTTEYIFSSNTSESTFAFNFGGGIEEKAYYAWKGIAYLVSGNGNKVNTWSGSDVDVTSKSVLRSSNNTWVLNGVTATGSAQIPMTTPLTRSLVLFGGNHSTNGIAAFDYCNLYVYNFKMYDNGTLIRNMIPAKRNSDNVLGMYDTVNGVFYTNQGTGTFVEGPTRACTGTNSYCTRTDYKNASVGTIIPESDILAYYVWIPRYKYQLFNVSNVDNTSPIEIQIEFEKGIAKTGLGTTNGTYLTHPAFTLGTDELKGIWVGKFETTPNATNPTIKPDTQSLREQNVSTQFATSQKFALNTDSYYLDSNTNVDSYMAKNSDWGAVAYLSHSKYGIDGEIYINNSSGYYTGRSAGEVGSATTTTTANGTYTYDGKDTTTSEYISDITPATKASTTGNITGIYDMSGGTFEYVMGVLGDTNTPTKPRSGYTSQYNSGFTGMLNDESEYKGDPEVLFPNTKYYQLYGTGVTSSYLGDALGETRGWYGDLKNWLTSSVPWLIRGDYYSNGVTVGVFSFRVVSGSNGGSMGFRSVLSVK